MKVSKAAAIWIDYHKTHSKKKYGTDHISPSLIGSSWISAIVRLIKLSPMMSFPF